MKEQVIINAGTESKICGASKKKSLLFVLCVCVEAAGEELTGMEGVKWYIRLSLICMVLQGGLHVGNCLQSSIQSWEDNSEEQLNKILLCSSNHPNSRAGEEPHCLSMDL